MSILKINFYSSVLQRTADLILVTPKYLTKKLHCLRPLYLLHGGGDDHTKWLRRTPLEQYASERNIIFILPEAGLNYYCNVKGMENSQTHVFQELPEFLEKQFAIKNHKKLLAGLSMGGYGACREAMLHPQDYSAIGSFSGDLNVLDSMENERQHTKVWNQKRYEFIFGRPQELEKSDQHLRNILLNNCGKSETFYYLTCGTDDALYSSNQSFYLEAKEQLEIRFEAWKGNHDWIFWNESLRKFLTLLDAKGLLEVGQ